MTEHKNPLDVFWVLKWDESITQGVFDTIINTLISGGYSEFRHAGFDVTYEKFCMFKHLRKDVGNKKQYCIDNNSQGCFGPRQISVRDIIGNVKT